MTVTFDKLLRYHADHIAPKSVNRKGRLPESDAPHNKAILAVELSPGESPIVWGEKKRPLTEGESKVVSALIGAGEEGLTSGELMEELGGKKGAITTLIRLKGKDAGWDRAIIFPGSPYGRIASRR